MSLDSVERPGKGRRAPEITRPSGPAVIKNRAGEVIERKFSTLQDPFEVTSDMREEGWDIEWKRESVHGEPHSHHLRHMKAQGWEEIPENRPGWEGRTRHQGLIAMERPKALTDAARREEKELADGVLRAQHQKFHGDLPRSLAPVQPQVQRSFERGPSRVALDD